MRPSTKDHCLLEDALYSAFPQNPLPAPTFEKRAEFRVALEFLDNKRWSEAVGMRLAYGELDACLSSWAKYLPDEIMRYYLPSHLMLASLQLKFGGTSNYPSYVMEGLLLPPPDPADNEAFDDALFVEAALSQYPDRGIGIYRVLTDAQRACVARYLDLYGAYKAAEFTEHARVLYDANRDIWRSSSV